MRIDILNAGSTKVSNLPELTRFFQGVCGSEWKNALSRYVRTFAGVTIAVPGPEALRVWSRDSDIVSALERSRQARSILLLLKTHCLELQYVEQLWEAAHKDRRLMADHEDGSTPMQHAEKLVAEFPKMKEEIIRLLGLTPAERGRIRGNTKPGPPAFRMSDVQKKIVQKIKNAEAAELDAIVAEFGSPGKAALASLVSAGVVVRIRNKYEVVEQ